MLPNQFLTSISIVFEVFSQLAAYQFPPGPFREHLCTCMHGSHTGYKNKPWRMQEWTVAVELPVKLNLLKTHAHPIAKCKSEKLNKKIKTLQCCSSYSHIQKCPPSL